MTEAATRTVRSSFSTLLAALFLLTACDGRVGPENGISAGSATLLDLPQQVLSEGSLLVVPGTRWDRHVAADGELGRWRFRTFARILCEVREVVAEPLEIGFLPDAVTAGFSFKVSWDDIEVDAAEIRREGDLWWIVIPAERLAPGHHELVVQRQHPPGTFGKTRHDNLFDELRFRHAGREDILEPAAAAAQQLIAQFLQHGVIGQAQERRGGLLAAASGEHRVALGDKIRRARFEPENFSSQPVSFRLSAGDHQATASVAPGERGELRLEIPGGSAELRLEVAGAGGAPVSGPFLWGLPALEPLERSEPPPPILLVTLDTTRRDAVAPYSDRPDLTPTLARLATHATVFDQAFSTAPWTLPSHASIFTGLYPSKHGAGVRDVQLPPGADTLAGLLRQRGYLTAGFSAGELCSSRFGVAQGFHYYRNPDQFETLGNKVAEYVDAFLDRYAEHPFFLFVNYFDPHAVFRAPWEYQERLGVQQLAAKIEDLPGWDKLLGGDMGAWRLAVEGEAPITPEVREYLRAAYLAEIAFTDDLLGRLFDRLRTLEIYDEALIIITADHGELLGEGGYVSHGARLDAELVEIPMIVKWPGQRAPQRVGDLVSLVDVFPTVLEVAGIDPPESDGRSLRGGDPEREKRSFVMLEEHEFLIHPLPEFMKVSRHLYGVQRPDFRHLVWEEDQACERRRNDAWQEEACTADRERVLRSIQAVLGVIDGEAPQGEMSDDVRESLKALGYI